MQRAARIRRQFSRTWGRHQNGSPSRFRRRPCLSSIRSCCSLSEWRLWIRIRWSSWSDFFESLLASKAFRIFLWICAIYALFGNDFRLALLPKDADPAFVVFSSIVFFAFVIEVLLQVYCRPGYLLPLPWQKHGCARTPCINLFAIGSFYFWLDVIATFSLLTEIPWMVNWPAYDSPTLNVVSTDQGDTIVRETTGFAVRLLRLLRIARLVRVIRLYKYSTTWWEALGHAITSRTRPPESNRIGLFMWKCCQQRRNRPMGGCFAKLKRVTNRCIWIRTNDSRLVQTKDAFTNKTTDSNDEIKRSATFSGRGSINDNVNDTATGNTTSKSRQSTDIVRSNSASAAHRNATASSRDASIHSTLLSTANPNHVSGIKSLNAQHIDLLHYYIKSHWRYAIQDLFSNISRTSSVHSFQSFRRPGETAPSPTGSTQNQVSQSGETIEPLNSRSRIGAALYDLTTRRVIVGLLLMVICVPLLALSEEDTSNLYLVGSLHRVADKPSSPVFSAAVSNIQRLAVPPFAALELDGDTYIQEMPVDALREVEILRIRFASEPSRDLPFLESLFDNRDKIQAAALSSIGLTLIVTVLLALAALSFSIDVTKLVLHPLGDMVAVVKNISDYPLRPVDLNVVASAELAHAIEHPDEPTEQAVEITYLTRTFLAIGGLLRMGFGHAGANIIAAKLNPRRELDVLLPAHKVTVVILHIRLSGIHSLAEKIGAALPLVLNSVFRAIHTVITAQGGLILRNSDDGVLAAWPLSSSESFATRSYSGWQGSKSGNTFPSPQNKRRTMRGASIEHTMPDAPAKSGVYNQAPEVATQPSPIESRQAPSAGGTLTQADDTLSEGGPGFVPDDMPSMMSDESRNLSRLRGNVPPIVNRRSNHSHSGHQYCDRSERCSRQLEQVPSGSQSHSSCLEDSRVEPPDCAYHTMPRSVGASLGLVFLPRLQETHAVSSSDVLCREQWNDLAVAAERSCSLWEMPFEAPTRVYIRQLEVECEQQAVAKWPWAVAVLEHSANSRYGDITEGKNNSTASSLSDVDTCCYSCSSVSLNTFADNSQQTIVDVALSAAKKSIYSAVKVGMHAFYLVQQAMNQAVHVHSTSAANFQEPDIPSVFPGIDIPSQDEDDFPLKITASLQIGSGLEAIYGSSRKLDASVFSPEAAVAEALSEAAMALHVPILVTSEAFQSMSSLPRCLGRRVCMMRSHRSTADMSNKSRPRGGSTVEYNTPSDTGAVPNVTRATDVKWLYGFSCNVEQADDILKRIHSNSKTLSPTTEQQIQLPTRLRRGNLVHNTLDHVPLTFNELNISAEPIVLTHTSLDQMWHIKRQQVSNSVCMTKSNTEETVNLAPTKSFLISSNNTSEVILCVVRRYNTTTVRSPTQSHRVRPTANIALQASSTSKAANPSDNAQHVSPREISVSSPIVSSSSLPRARSAYTMAEIRAPSSGAVIGHPEFTETKTTSSSNMMRFHVAHISINVIPRILQLIREKERQEQPRRAFLYTEGTSSNLGVRQIRTAKSVGHTSIQHHNAFMNQSVRDIPHHARSRRTESRLAQIVHSIQDFARTSSRHLTHFRTSSNSAHHRRKSETTGIPSDPQESPTYSFEKHPQKLEDFPEIDLTGPANIQDSPLTWLFDPLLLSLRASEGGIHARLWYDAGISTMYGARAALIDALRCLSDLERREKWSRGLKSSSDSIEESSFDENTSKVEFVLPNKVAAQCFFARSLDAGGVDEYCDLQLRVCGSGSAPPFGSFYYTASPKYLLHALLDTPTMDMNQNVAQEDCDAFGASDNGREQAVNFSGFRILVRTQAIDLIMP